MLQLKTLLLVSLGGGGGAVCRYLVGQYCSRYLPIAGLWSTCVVNISACLVLGLLWGLASRGVVSDSMKLLLMTGFCGGYSTFSTFSMELLQQMQSGNAVQAILYLLASLLGGVLAIGLGYMLAR